MESVSRLAVHLDTQMLLLNGVKISDETTRDEDLPACDDPVNQFHGRLLIKYLRKESYQYYSSLSGVDFFPGRHFLTPSPVAKKDLVPALNLPPLDRPVYALLLDPVRLDNLVGPRRIAGGYGIEYLLLDGFGSDAIAYPQWAQEYK